ncbi:MAG TPA: hypothetical protein VF527_10885 [Pyrinomonadaceae bacterium]|jgi:hypothetical protein
MSIKTLTAFCLIFVSCLSSVLAQAPDEERVAFTVPAAPWSLTLPKGGFVVARQLVKPDGRHGYFMLTDERTGMTVSFFIEPVKDCKDSRACRDMVWKMGNPLWENPQQVVQSEIGGVSYFEFFMPTLQGRPIKQQNLYAQFVQDAFWVDMHISKVLYQPEEHVLFERIIKSVKFEPKAAQSQKQE